MLEIKDLACQRGDRLLFRGVSFTLKPGELMLVTGPNGSGKTSLLRMVCGLLAPVDGDILWHGKSIRSQREPFHANLTFIGHHGAVKEELTPVENLGFSCRLAGHPVEPQRAINALSRMGLARCLELPAKALSAGQRRRTALARLLLAKTPLWILDEPLTALDVHALTLIQGLIDNHLKSDGMVMLTTHQALDIPGVEPLELRLAA
jgi:heme exporter protein A